MTAEEITKKNLTFVIEESIYDLFIEQQEKIERLEAAAARMTASATATANERNHLWQILEALGHRSAAHAVADADMVAASVAALSALPVDVPELPAGWVWAVDGEGEHCAVDPVDQIAVYWDRDGTIALDLEAGEAAAPDEVHEAVRRRNRR
ncbi:MAG: hypothetical protein IPH07_24315 [Deltaproteobacteria bacterium]|nr:hypothetical protein [Deltaproteobacteria bacterium]